MAEAYIKGAETTEAVCAQNIQHPPPLSTNEVEAVKQDLLALEALDSAVAML